VSRGEYLGGIVLVTLVLGGCGGAAVAVTRSRLGWMGPEARAVAWALLFTGAVALVHVVPLMLGALTRGTPVVLALLLAAGATRLSRVPVEAAEPSRAAPSDRVSSALGALALAAGVVFVMAYLATQYDTAVSDIDSTTFLIPGVGRWIQEGSLWLGDEFAPGWGFPAYPMTGNLMQLAVMLPWHADFALRFVAPAFLGLTGLAVYAMGAELGAPRAAAAGTAVVAALLPIAAIVGLDNGQTDAIMAAWFACGAFFVLRHGRTGRREELWLAGLGLGLAAGTKWYGPPEVAALLGVWALARLTARQPLRTVTADALRVAGITAGVGGIWLVRNVAMFENPLFPGGARLFPAPKETIVEQVDRSIASYAGDMDVLREVVAPQLWASFYVGGLILAVGALLAVALAVRARHGRALAVAIAAAAVAGTYACLPNSALTFADDLILVSAATRYALPAFALAAAATAWASGSVKGGPALLAAAAPLVLLVGVDRVETVSNSLSHVSFAAIVTAALLLAAAVAAVALIRARRPGRGVLLAATAVAALVAVWAMRDVQERFTAARYANTSPVLRALREPMPEGRRIALAGEAGQGAGPGVPLVAMGPRFTNVVHYVGATDHHLLVMHRDRGAFVEGLEAGDFDLLVVGRDAQGGSEPATWAASAGWRTVEEDSLYVLLAPPDPK
jgi:hypothetical protein